MNTTLIKLFNAALPESTLSFATVNAEAIKRGYIVEPNACTKSVLAFLREQDINPNATFYKDWEDITSKTRIELLFDQLLHYMTTYGTNFALGNGYVPNDGEINIQTTFDTYKVIKSISEDDLAKRCYDLLVSGIALKKDTMNVVADYLIAWAKLSKQNINSIDIDEIKNREALIYICDKLGITPHEKFSLFRYIIYKTTGSEMIIKNKTMIDAIKRSQTQFNFSKLSKRDMEGLASIFLRYKDLFLAFKHTYGEQKAKGRYGYTITQYVPKTSSNASYINKLRKMAIKLHEPMKQGFWQNIFTTEHTLDELNAHMDELTTYKKVALMQSCLERATATDNQFYLVRNQKAFLREGYKPNCNVAYVAKLYAALSASVVETLRKNSTKVVKEVNKETGEVVEVAVPKSVRVVNGVSIALPTSEKSFIGNYPFGTTYMLNANNYFGIYWRNEWGTRDYDLSYISWDGAKIGWDSDFYNRDKDIIFSGDMTNANPEAAEVLLMKNAGHRGLVKVNQYSGAEKSKFQFFFGQDAAALQSRKGYMVDPASIKLKVEVKHEQCREQQVAVVGDDRVVLMAVSTGNGIVSRGNAKHTQMVQDAIINKSKCFVNAEDMLRAAGYNVVDETYEGAVDIDFANLDKDSLISLMMA